jgi:hypothetical protein
MGGRTIVKLRDYILFTDGEGIRVSGLGIYRVGNVYDPEA